jgi:type VI protein secretion system component Hcp
MHLSDKGNKIEGEVLDKDFENEIEIDSWEWELSRLKDDKRVNVGGDAKAEPSVFRFTKTLDSSSSKMLWKMQTGDKSADRLGATVTLREDSDMPFLLAVQLENIRITEYSVTGKDGEKRGEIEETWTFNYDRITFQHTVEKGSRKAGAPFISTHKRSASSNTDKPNPVKDVVEKVEKLTDNERADALSELKKKYPKVLT